MTVTFTSRDIENHVLARVRHLVNRIVVFWSIVCFLLLQSYYNDKSYGLYSSPTKLLKLSSSIIAPVLSELLNISIKSGSYPSKLKIVKITPIFKSDDESDANNY